MKFNQQMLGTDSPSEIRAFAKREITMADNEGRNAGLSIIVGIFAVIGVIYAFAHFAMDKGIGPGIGDTLLQWIALFVIIGIVAALVKINKGSPGTDDLSGTSAERQAGVGDTVGGQIVSF